MGESRKREARKIILDAGALVLANVTEDVATEDLYKEALSDLATIAGGKEAPPVPYYNVCDGPSEWENGIQGYYVKKGADAGNTLYVNQDNGNSRPAYLFAVKEDGSSKIIWMIHGNPTFRNAQKGGITCIADL